jgi:protease-4
VRRLARRAAACAVGCSFGLLLAAEASAEPVYEPERLPALGRSVAGTDDSSALLQNPANLGYLPAAEFRWTGMYLRESLAVPYQGHAFSFAFPLPFSLATGLRLDFIDPPSSAFGGQSANYQWLTWALAYRASDSLSFGFSLQHSYSDGPVANGMGSYTAAITDRPIRWLGLSLVGHHINGPLDGENARRLQDGFGAKYTSLGPSLTTALSVRPLGTRSAELGLEARYLFEPEQWEPRATLGVDLPYVGRIQGEFMITDPYADKPAWRAAASLSLFANAQVGSTELEGGAVTGTGLGESGSYNFFNGVAIRGFREPTGFDVPRHAVRLRIEGTPDTREHVALLRKLWSLSEEDSVAAVVFELRTSPAGSLAHVQELRDAVRVLQARGKKVLCHLEDASGSSVYLCAAADRTLINPAGGVRFAGLRLRHFYFKDLLDKIGVQADFVRIGAHKSAPERFTRSSASDVSRADSIDLLQQIERWFTGDIAHDRKIPVDVLRDRFAKGPFIATEAKDAGLVDATAFDDEVEKATATLTGERVRLSDGDFANIAPQSFGKQRSLAMVYVDGDIVDGRSRTIPFLGMELVGSYTIAETLRKLRDNPLIGAVVLRVESPGGSSMASDVMWREVLLTSKKKPVIVSMGDVAASGGYYVAAPATKIYANPLTITGSIGVFYGKADVSGLLSKLGVNVEVYKTAPRADAESFFRPFTDEEKIELQRKVGQFYDVFLTRVAEGRRMGKDAVDKVGQGRVWTGEQAKQHGLVDELGGLRQALAEARRLGGLAEDSPIIELPKIPTSLLGQILGIPGIHAGELTQPTIALPPELTGAVKAMAPFLVHPADRPLMRLEVAPVEQ